LVEDFSPKAKKSSNYSLLEEASLLVRTIKSASVSL
jgi:hypothetical protein